MACSSRSCLLRTCLVSVCAIAVGCEPDADGQGSLVPDGTFPADVVLRNRVALVMPVEIALLEADDALDCDAVEDDPAAALPRERFDVGEVRELSPHAMTVVWPHEPGERECYAAWVETDGLGARVLFWRDGEPPIAPYIQNSCCDVGEGVIELIPVEAGARLDLLGNDWFVFEPST